MGNAKHKMPVPQEPYDFRAVLNTVCEDLVDKLELDPVLKALEKRKVFRSSKIRDIQEKDPTSERVKALLQLVQDADHSRYVLFKQCLDVTGQQRLVEVLEAAERGEYKPRVMRKKPRTEEDKLLEVLKEDLINYYREKESTISVAPLVEQHEVEITRFYVRPPMMAHNKPNVFGQKKQSKNKSGEKRSEEKTNIRSYRELLLNGNDPYKEIYVTADVGMGKTSFAKMLAVTWCEAHAPKYRLFRKRLEKHDIETMEKFDFLFLIKLRDFETCPNCSLDKMTLEMMKSKLQHKSQYTEYFLEKVLCCKRCLIIVDGLDGWIHPQSCRRGEVIPHRRHWPDCTVLTTTRPWKLSTALLSMADIDRQVEISQLDETTARKLESRAIEFLNENQRQNGSVAANSEAKTVIVFEKSVPKQLLGHILYIPFMLLQMICLWFGNNPIGKSFCEVYSTIIELTLTRWLVKTESGHVDCKCEPSMEHEIIKLKCMENNRHCQRYMPLLLKIGQLAFWTLFNVIREESLLFDKRQVIKYLSIEELGQCLDMGLLSQVKDTTSVTEVRLQLYFPHKTLHEFFSALFIATDWNSKKTMSIKQTISNKCTSVDDILEMSEVFVFVCGLNPEVYSDISCHLATIVSTDQRVIDYRNGIDSRLLEDYQRMQISCFLESTRNQHTECKTLIEDMFVGRYVFYRDMKEDELQPVEKILPDSACSMKSLTLGDLQSAGEIVRILEHAEFPCLERLSVQECELTWFQSVLTSAAHTLKYLKLNTISLTDHLPSAGEIVRILEHAEFPCLERLSVQECELTLFQGVLTSAAHTLKYLKLGSVSLTDGVLSSVARLNNLHALCVVNVDVSSNSLNAVSDCISSFMSLQKLKLHFQYEPSDTDKKPEQCEADLSDTDLSDTDLSDTDLTDTGLSDTGLSDTDKKPEQCETDLSDTDEKPDHREASINSLLRSTEAKTMLTYLSLTVNLSHQNYVLDLSKHNKLQELELWLPLTQLHIYTEHLVKCKVYEMYEFSAPAVSSLLAQLHGAPVLETLTLTYIKKTPPRIDIIALPLLTDFTLWKCDLRGCTVTLTLPVLTKFTLWECDLRGSIVILSPEMTSLKTITLWATTVSMPCWREMFLSISSLPQPVTVKLMWINMTVGKWKELLFDILGKLPKSIRVEMLLCKGPSQQEWRNIVDDMKASQAFYIKSTSLDLFEAFITFDTVVVRGRLLNQMQYI